MSTRIFSSAFVFFVLLFSRPMVAVEIPAGTDLRVRLTGKVSSEKSKPKDLVEAILIAPVVVNGGLALAPGAKLTGHVATATPSPNPNERAVLEVAFNTIQAAGGRAIPIKSRLLEVDNAREAVDDTGKILGIVAAETFSARLNQGIGKVAERYAGLGDLLQVAKAAVLKDADSTIAYEPGVEMTVRVLAPFEWKEAAHADELQPFKDESSLSRLVTSEPFQTYSEQPRTPSDITNLMFIGTAQQLEQAFQASGWSTAQALSEQSKFETFRAIVEARGYKEAPVSTLLLDGRSPDYVFQKGNNTFAQRHHLRIWKRPERFEGQPVWVCSSTHDTGIAFSDQNHTFIHKIDSNIDKERAKVVADLLFSKHVKSLALVARPDAPQHSQNATGDALDTDANMAVLLLN